MKLFGLERFNLNHIRSRNRSVLGLGRLSRPKRCPPLRPRHRTPKAPPVRGSFASAAAFWSAVAGAQGGTPLSERTDAPRTEGTLRSLCSGAVAIILGLTLTFPSGAAEKPSSMTASDLASRLSALRHGVLYVRMRMEIKGT